MGTDIFWSCAAVVFGAVLGSFLNALSFRFNTGISIVHGRSRCMHCGHQLQALDLIPIVSFLFLGGKCRYCHSHLSLQYPLVEGIAGVLSLGVYLLYPEAILYFFWLLVWMFILFGVVYDIRHTIVPWSCSLFLMMLAVGSLFISLPPTTGSLIAGPVLALPLFLLSLVSGGRWMGWADSAFELSLGWILGVTQGVTALMLAVWSGAIVGIVLLVLSKRVTMRSEIPFAPFLALGAAVTFFFHVDFFKILPFAW